MSSVVLICVKCIQLMAFAVYIYILKNNGCGIASNSAIPVVELVISFITKTHY